MSTMLGPIHHMMNERIQLVAARCNELEQFARERMSPSQQEELDAALEPFDPIEPGDDLATMIGDQPIHAWLQARMEGVMLREAALWARIADRAERRNATSGKLRDHGMRVAEAMLSDEPQVAKDARVLLQHLEGIMLQSMPCDRVSEVVAISANSFIVRRNLLFHGPLWKRAGLEEETALALQEAWMGGIFSVIPGARFVRAELSQNGHRFFDDRVTLPAAGQMNG